MKNTVNVAVIQDSAVPFDAKATTLKINNLIKQASENGAELIVFPEAFLGTYPKGLNFDSPVGNRAPSGRDEYLRYFNNSVNVHGEEIASIIEAVKNHQVFVVLGIIENDGGTLYCTVLYLDGNQGGLIGKHRKLMPTGSERLVWGFGDGSTMEVMDTHLGKIGAVICWENYMPALRMSMYAQGIEIYCAPTADDRDSWIASMKHIALEGRCFVLSACQYIQRKEYPTDYPSVLNFEPEDAMMKGGSTIIGPLGEEIVSPLLNEKGILYATLDRNDLIKSKLDFDVVGHYSRPDIFTLEVNRQPQKNVRDS